MTPLSLGVIETDIKPRRHVAGHSVNSSHCAVALCSKNVFSSGAGTNVKVEGRSSAKHRKKIFLVVLSTFWL